MSDSTPTPRPSLLANSELWGGLVGLGLGLFVVRAGYRLGLGTVNDPGSGSILFYTGVLMVLFALSIAIAALHDGGPSVASRWDGVRWDRPLVVISCLAAFSLALEPLGFLLAAVPLMLALLRLIDPVRWSVALPLGIAAPVIVWFVLKKALAIQLPSGAFGLG